MLFRSLLRPLVIWVHEEGCPACTTGKDNLIALAKSGYSAQVDFYLTTFHTFRSLMPRRKVEVVPTQLLFNTRGVRKLLATGASVEQLKKALDELVQR